MDRKGLVRQIKEKGSYLCVGLDTDINKIPTHLKKEKDPVFAFNKAIVDATYKYCVAYKPNIAFYECMGPSGWESLQKTIEYIPKDIFTIADAKRGDIGNTSAMYAKTFFDTYNFDSVTVAPYMGSDSVEPFLQFEGKWVILLALTSNAGSVDFQSSILDDGSRLYERVLKNSGKWAGPDKMMFVVGATKAENLKSIRQIVPGHFLLVPGVGAQGGSLEEVSKYGFNQDCGLLVNSSRGIIYASNGQDFASKATEEAKKLQEEMRYWLDKWM